VNEGSDEPAKIGDGVKNSRVAASRRSFLQKSGLTAMLGVSKLFAGTSTVPSGSPEPGSDHIGPDPIYEKPLPHTVDQLAGSKIGGVAALEVDDYSPAGYKGSFKPGPPHADLNPKRAVIVSWKDHSHRVIFSHEASYCPWMELPNGVGLGNQFFEGNSGYAELFNENGRKERNSSVDIIWSGPDRTWVRWNYCCVNAQSDSHPALRGTEDYIAFPNGYVWRRLTYESLIPKSPNGYSWQPIDFYTVVPSGMTWADLFFKDKEQDDFHVGSVLALYSDEQYDVFWNNQGEARRNGDAELLLKISRSPGFALIMPFKAGFLFTVIGPPAGFPAHKSQVVDNSFTDTGGLGWRSERWDHWPVGFLNAQIHYYKPGSPYPYSFGPFSHWIIDKPLKNWKVDYFAETRNMELNRWSERHVYYTLTGVGSDLESIRHLGRQWLDKGDRCAGAESIASLPPLRIQPA
jgi:hypothetical protein